MLLPFREHLDFGPTPYDLLQDREGIPVVKGNVVSDVLTLELGRWERMGAMGYYLNLSNQQQTDAYVCEIAPAARLYRNDICSKRLSMLLRDAAPHRYGRTARPK